MQDLTQADMEAVLKAHNIGTLACVMKGKPFQFPMAYVYAHGALYGQTLEGFKTDVLHKNPEVCFSVVEKHDNGWRSVLCFGEYEELDFAKVHAREVKEAVTVLFRTLRSIQKFLGIEVLVSTATGTPLPMSMNGRKSILFRIPVREMTGKRGGAK